MLTMADLAALSNPDIVWRAAPAKPTPATASPWT